MKLAQTGIRIADHISGRRYFYIVFFILFALGINELAHFVILRSVRSNWPNLRVSQTEKESLVIQESFTGIQSGVSRIVRRTAGDIAPIIRNAYLTDRDIELLFDRLGNLPLTALQGVEYRNAKGDHIAWWGRIPDSFVLPENYPLESEGMSVISRGTVFATLSAVTPVRSGDGGVLGYVVAHEIFETRYTLSPRFFQIKGWQSELRDKLGKSVVVHVDEMPEPDIEQYTLPLNDLSGRPVAVALVQKPTLDAYIADVDESFRSVRDFLILGLSCFLIVVMVVLLRRFSYPVIMSVAAIVILWLIRYIWIGLSIPARFIGSPVFDPAYYASLHGGGIVQSPGDLLITAFCLMFSALLVFHLITMRNVLRIPQLLPRGSWWWVTIVCMIVFLLYMGLIRAYGAGIRSLVFDSSVRFTEPGSIIPSPMLAVMQLNLLTLTASFVLIGTTFGSVTLRLAEAAYRKREPVYLAFIYLILFIAAALFYTASRNPLVGFWYYAGVPVFLVSITVLVRKGRLQAFRLYRIRSILFLAGLSVILAIPVLDRKVHEFDREQVQVIADRVVRPTDAWKEFLLRQTLQECRENSELRAALSSMNSADLDRSAFRVWAASMLSREGYDASVTIYNRDGEQVSSFSIGIQLIDRQAIERAILDTPESETFIQHIETVYGTATVYGGRTFIHDEYAEPTGSVTVSVVTGPGTLFRGYAPDILRTQLAADITARYGDLIISEFQNERLVTTTAPGIPVSHTIPPHIRTLLDTETLPYVWERETIEGTRYETLYVRSPNQYDSGYYAISMMRVDIRWQIFYAIKLIFFAIVVCTGILVLAGVYFLVQGKRYRPTFRETILIGLLSVSLIPILIVAYLNREFTADQMTATVSQQLIDETKRLALQFERGRGNRVGVHFDESDRIAADLGIDFVIYHNATMAATSRSDLFEAELLGRRLNGYAYINLVLRGKNFVTREEAIGQSSYIVGYRPLYDEQKNLYGVLAVPGLYRQSEMDDELARRDAFLFGIYALVILSVVLAGTVVANKMSRPIELLTDATNRVAGGELDVKLEYRGDNEIGNLMRSFTVMTRRLKENREELARVERELAWREMARQVAHEIRNPLTPMKLSIQQLRQERKDNAKDFDKTFDATTRMLLQQIETLSRIASEFSRFARMPVSKPETVDINGILKRAIALFSQKTDVDFQLNFDDTIPVIDADGEELQRAFVNLIRNGVQAMPEGGTLSIETSHEDGTITISITDTGTGIPPEVRLRLFEPNFSTKTDGMGLGLAIVKKTIQELKGSIEIHSTENIGTTVRITLPVTRTQE
jgi:two-component system, NtrC family, nitrogen regulation sensor histidine kinase NtrY